ncbi:chaperone protein ClpB4, mitochondrial [Artemisia annua]|uniref:Chaperone protein ClpB4, mitochondrial n=1 Tax=Artemisia annua TaxID=35608 RepID=A0A2U1PE77_ARTAN|nr:chaperone protein ClpB4, mitochondrial [Artemisia annua]
MVTQHIQNLEFDPLSADRTETPTFADAVGKNCAGQRGDFEERLKADLKEVTASNGKIVVFIDEIQTVVSARATGGPTDVGNLLKPILGQGEL